MDSAKLIAEIEALLKDMNNVIDAHVHSEIIKSGLKSAISNINIRLGALKGLPMPTESHGSRPVIELDFMTLTPLTKEVTCDGLTVKLPRAEFTILYQLACSPGVEVDLGTNQTVLTRLSHIRRALPVTKYRIESLGKGKYMLNGQLKSQVV